MIGRMLGRSIEDAGPDDDGRSLYYARMRVPSWNESSVVPVFRELWQLIIREWKYQTGLLRF